jgi:quinol monooxygenase YgiN
MSQDTLRIVARVVAQADKVAEVHSCLIDLIEPTRQEPGCISYELLQNNSDPSDFTFVEEWASEDAVAAHFKADHFLSVVSRVTPLLAAEPDIRKYSLVR